MDKLHIKLEKPCATDGIELSVFNCDDEAFEKLTEQLTKRSNNGSEWVAFVGMVVIYRA